MSNLWFADMVRSVIGSISVGAGAPDRSVQINVGGFLGGFGTWLGQSNGELEATPRTAGDPALVVHGAVGQTSTIVDFENSSTLDFGGTFQFRGIGLGSTPDGATCLAAFIAEDNQAYQFVTSVKNALNDTFSFCVVDRNSGTVGFGAANSGATNYPEITLDPSDDSAVINSLLVGFFSLTTKAVKQTVAGAKLPGDTVMASLLFALSAYGLITDTTT